jgi:hypothetical protein
MNLQKTAGLFLTFAFLLLARHSALAMAGELKHPSIGLPENTPKDVCAQIIRALDDKQCRFLDGHFINASTTLRYGGQTESLNRMLAHLVECNFFKIRIRFTKQDPGVSWTINHNAWADSENLQILLNVAAETIELEKLELPAFGKNTAR